MANPLVLKTALGKHQHVAPLKEGRVTSERLTFEFIEFDPLPKAFRRMIRDGDLDVSEMAVVNHLLAYHYGKPIVALPIPLWSRLPHTNLVCRADSPLRGPKDLEGGSSGVRAYAQTSGVWVRGMLASEYDVDLRKISWVTTEDAHVAEYVDPPGVVRETAGRTLRQLLLEGEVQSIMGERVVDPGDIRTVIPNAAAEAEAWVRKTELVPVNHVLCVKAALLAEHPWLACELTAMFDAARGLALAEGAPETPPYDLESNRRSLQLVLDFCTEQQIVPRAYSVDEVFLSPDARQQRRSKEVAR